MEDITIEMVKKRVVKGVAILTARTFIMQLVALLANVLLTVFLEPAQYGVFFLVSAVINFLIYFSDIGFAASLIQKKEKLTEIELKTIFTTQQALILVLIGVVYLITPTIKNIYNLNTEAVYLLWALTFSFFLSSLKVIPSVLMERRLEFNTLIIPQLVETIAFNVVAVFLAWRGFGINSFTIAVLVRGFLGVAVTYLIRPWRPALSFSPQALKSVLKFGLPYQANTLLAMVKDDGMTLFLASILGTGGMGLLAWAQKWAFAPLRFFMDQVIKVTFPAFSRLQDEKAELSNAISKSILYICLLVFPSLIMLILLVPSLVEIIPKYSKWNPALLALTLLTITSALAAITTPITNALNAIGKISTTFKLMLMWTLLTWIFIPPLTLNFGLNGAALGFTLVGLSSVIALIITSKFVVVDYLQAVGKPILVAAILGIVVSVIRKLIPISLTQVIVMIMGGILTFIISTLVVEPKILNYLKNKLVLSLVFLIFSIFFTPQVFAKDGNFVSVVNPVRGSDFWDLKNQQPPDAVKGQVQILQQLNLSATWLIRFDVLNDQEILTTLPASDEKGLFLEITPTWSEKAGIKYHQSDSWHKAGSAFLTGYEPTEREKLVDAAFDEFKKIFGVYPKSVGAWWIDSFSLGYMQKKYGITAALIVADQYSTDNYQIWGQYFSTPYYPSKGNGLRPAQSLENKLPVVITQWAARDPVNSYGNGVFESTFSLQANDYIDYHNLDTKYFSKLLDIYTNQPFNKFSHLVVGLENSYSWNKYKNEYQNQIKTLVEKRNLGQFKVIALGDFAKWYQDHFPNLSPEQIIVADDPLQSFKKVVWFMNPYYRAGWFYNQQGSVFRDLRQYIEGEEELCFKKRCDWVNFATSATRVLDEVSFGQTWVIDEGNITDFKVTYGDNLSLSYLNEAAKLRTIEFLPRDISVDGKISSIDGTILDATKHQLDGKESQTILQQGFFKWSLPESVLKIIKFLGFLILGCLIPGLLLINKVLPKEIPFMQKITLAAVLGFTIITLLFYLFSLFNLKQITYVYLFINLVILVKNPKTVFGNFSPRLSMFNFLIIGLICLGTIFQQMPTFKNGLNFPLGLYFWGPNTHDGIWHLALINQLTISVPPQNPIFSGEVLKNYHYFYDLLVAVTHYLSQVPVMDLLFRFYPVTFSSILGIGTYYLIKSISRQSTNLESKLALFFGIYLVYFAGSFGWIVEYIKLGHLGGESAFWANQSISFNLNPPYALSLLIVIAILQLLPFTSKVSILILTILCGTLIAFKSYAAILILLSLLLVGFLKRNKYYLFTFLTSSFLSVILFLSTFSINKQLIIFSPFWFIHSMIDSADRVGWTRLTLARVAGLEQGNWFKFIAAETISLIIFILGNLGTRLFALFSLTKIKPSFTNTQDLFLLIFSSASLFIPIFFIQAGNPWNTIQFIYYFLYISALVGGIVIAWILVKIPYLFAVILALLILSITPINSWASANGYLSYQPHALISNFEIEALEFLRSKEEGVVLTYPYDKNLKTKIAEPWTLFVYDSTAYVSAISKKAVYLEDEPQNQILLTNYKKRLAVSKDFFLRPDKDFLINNQIKYIYLQKIFKIRISEGLLENIFENDEIIIYKTK